MFIYYVCSNVAIAMEINTFGYTDHFFNQPQE